MTTRIIARTTSRPSDCQELLRVKHLVPPSDVRRPASRRANVPSVTIVPACIVVKTTASSPTTAHTIRAVLSSTNVYLKYFPGGDEKRALNVRA